MCIFSLERRPPFKKVLFLTGLLMCCVLSVMVGNAVNHMQIADWLPITPVAGLTFPAWTDQWPGIYSTWQGLTAPIGSIVVVIGSFMLLESQRRIKQTNVPTSSIMCVNWYYTTCIYNFFNILR